MIPSGVLVHRTITREFFSNSRAVFPKEQGKCSCVRLRFVKHFSFQTDGTVSSLNTEKTEKYAHVFDRFSIALIKTLSSGDRVSYH